MPRNRKDGTPCRAARKQKLTELSVRHAKPEADAYLVWDTQRAGFALQVQPTGHKAWKVVYPFARRRRWYTIGSVAKIGLSDARAIAGEVLLRVARGEDPCAQRKDARDEITFGKLAERYVEDFAKQRNKSWQQAANLVRFNLLPHWAKRGAGSIERKDVVTRLKAIAAKSPSTANQVLAAASAIFKWAVNEELVSANPCQGIPRNKTESRERILADDELPLFWREFSACDDVRGAALKVILLTGQRPGEVRHLSRAHIRGEWWEMPGKPDAALGWPGTKNGRDHRVWLPQQVRDIIAQLDGEQPFGGRDVGAQMKAIWTSLDKDARKEGRPGTVRITPHDLRRTHGTMVTRLGFGRDLMNRIQNHRDGGIASVYDRHGYSNEIKRAMEAVAGELLALSSRHSVA